MKRLISTAIVLVIALSGCDSGVSEDGSDGLSSDAVAAKQAKVLLCHVGSEPGVDEGSVSLIEVALPAKHIGNPAHAYGDLSDYLPGAYGASGEGKDDTDGDGVADGCEIPEDTCPCWVEADLGLITADNLAPDACASYDADDPVSLTIASDNPLGLSLTFQAGTAGPYCRAEGSSDHTRDLPLGLARVCMAQIAARCGTVLAPPAV